MKRIVAIVALFAVMAGTAYSQVGSYWVGQAWHTGGTQEYQSKPNSTMLQSWRHHQLEIRLHICDLDGSNCHRQYTIHASGRYDVGSSDSGQVFLFHSQNAVIRNYLGQTVCSGGTAYAGGADEHSYVVETYFTPARCTAPLPGRQFIHVRLDTSNCTTFPKDTCPWVAEISLER